MKSSNHSIRFRMCAFAALLIPLAIGVICRLVHLQIFRGEELRAKAASKYTGSRKTVGKRGEIYDMSGNLLVGNMPCVTLVIDPTHVKTPEKRRKMAAELARQLGKNAAELEAKLAPERPRLNAAGKAVYNPDGSPAMVPVRFSILAKHIPLEKARQLRDHMNKLGYKEILYQPDTMRHYPKNGLLANILGLTQGDSASNAVAVFGVEKFYNDKIAPSGGKEVFERDRRGVPLTYGNRQNVSARDGANIYLTIDEVLQSIMEEELDEAYKKWNPKTIYAVMVDPRTGNVLAIGQRPSFDPNSKDGIQASDCRNRIVEDRIEPGSIAKALAVAGALDNNVVRPETRFFCENGFWLYCGKKLTDTHKYENLTVSDIIKVSSNIGTAKIALMMGEKMLYDTFTSFGMGERSGLPLRPETRCVLRHYSKWDKLTITRAPIGYSINVTPVQMARAYCALANHGRLPTLRLVDRIENPETGEIYNLPMEPPRQIFRRPQTGQEITQMLKGVTGPGGTAKQAAIPGYQVAGKTGTSRKSIGRAGYSNKYFASFVGYVPADNPAFVLLVTTDEPKGSSYGGTVSGPIFRKIAQRALNYMQIPPDPALMTPTKD